VGQGGCTTDSVVLVQEGISHGGSLDGGHDVALEFLFLNGVVCLTRKA
jgi:hypothetical protein